MNFIITRRKLIKELAYVIATTHIRADKWFYIHKDQEMSSWTLDGIISILKLCENLNITESVFEKAYKIYDFRNSGKKDFEPNLELLKSFPDHKKRDD